ncbi:MAG: hypothetical protein J6S49_07860, partial [Erysipelotrichaceae bacterium]|nr:hypothetical protein [Erysipelotrichaceae bacterium]
MYNPYQRKLIRDMIINSILSLFLIVNLIPVNIGARIVAEETMQQDQISEVGENQDRETENNIEEEGKENQDAGNELSGGSELDDVVTGQEGTGNGEKPAEGNEDEEEIPGEGAGTQVTPGEGGTNNNTPTEENDNVIEDEENKENTTDKEKINEDLEDIENKEVLTKGTSVKALALGAELDDATDGEEEGETVREAGDTSNEANEPIGEGSILYKGEEHNFGSEGVNIYSNRSGASSKYRTIKNSSSGTNYISNISYDAGEALYEVYFVDESETSGLVHIKSNKIESSYDNTPLGIKIGNYNGTSYTWDLVYKITWI